MFCVYVGALWLRSRRLTQTFHVGILWPRVSPNPPSNGTSGGATAMSLGTVVSEKNFRNRGLRLSYLARNAAVSVVLASPSRRFLYAVHRVIYSYCRHVIRDIT